jgi:hypothetical protein
LEIDQVCIACVFDGGGGGDKSASFQSELPDCRREIDNNNS